MLRQGAAPSELAQLALEAQLPAPVVEPAGRVAALAADELELGDLLSRLDRSFQGRRRPAERAKARPPRRMPIRPVAAAAVAPSRPTLMATTVEATTCADVAWSACGLGRTGHRCEMADKPASGRVMGRSVGVAQCCVVAQEAALDVSAYAVARTRSTPSRGPRRRHRHKLVLATASAGCPPSARRDGASPVGRPRPSALRKVRRPTGGPAPRPTGRGGHTRRSPRRGPAARAGLLMPHGSGALLDARAIGAAPSRQMDPCASRRRSRSSGRARPGRSGWQGAPRG